MQAELAFAAKISANFYIRNIQKGFPVESFIKAKNLTFKYDSNFDSLTLNNISLKIKKGEFICILGKNGSGKSTLAKNFNALLLPTGGKVYVNNMDTKDETVNFEIHRLVGLVLQNPENQIVSSIVEEDVAFGPENLNLNPAEIRRRVEAALDIVGMKKFAKNITYNLSGGQKQKLALAGVLTMHPQCIILDEPTSMLDFYSRKEILTILKKINHQYNINIILITHFTDEALLADRVLIMDQGRIILDDIPMNIFSNADLVEKYNLSLPHGAKLLLELKKRGFKLSLSDFSVEGCASTIAKFLEENSCR